MICVCLAFFCTFVGTKMSTNVEQRSTIEPSGVQTTVPATASSAASSSSKISMFTAKSGFVIPKNKLSGSLVPIFRGSKKTGGSDVVNEESTKEVQRKTKWGTDLTQDPAVRKGIALAYQTRVDQITKQLTVGILEAEDNEDSPLPAQADPQSSFFRNNTEESDLLELEKREAIGEILKLNPSYKAPPDYKPLLKEAKVSVPMKFLFLLIQFALLPLQIKEFPGYNFIGIIFDPASDTQKRLEKETGAKIRVYGTKARKGEKVEITSSDGNEAKGTFEELYVQVSADTYEKVDAAVALIEMLVTPVSVNQSAVSTTPTSVSTENAAVVEQSQGTSTPNTTPPFGVNQEPANPMMGSAQAPQAQFQPYQGSWFPMGPPQTPTHPPSGFVLPPNSNQVQPSSTPFNPSQHMPSLFGPRPFPSQNPSLGLSRPQQPVLQRPFMVQPPPFGQYGPPRNPQPDVSAPPPFMGNQPSSTGHSPIARTLGPSLSQHMPITTSGSLPTLFPSQGFRTMTSQPIIGSGAPPSNNSTVNMVSPRPMQSSSPIPQSQLFMARAATPNPIPNPLFGSNPIAPPVASTSTPPPPLPPPSQGGIPSFTPIKPQHPIAGDFTFQPHWPHNSASQAVPRPGTQPMMQNMRPTNPIAPPPQLPQSPSFRPAIQPSSSQPLMQGIIPRPQLSNQMNPFAGNPTANSAPLRNPLFPNPTPMPPNSVGPQMGLRNLNQTPFPHGPGIPLQIPPNFQAARGRPPNQHRGGLAFGPGSQQIYDPFSPSSVSAAAIQGGAVPKMRKQESDPEYEDLMASVGVK
ncbi:hypothetical protein RHGRI_038179 [Rhododendron griersonianum]|uniref:KHDC4/BBP-like KH-domain type I domain-containing protein n=1 Tax=Rhododendron griersonianum TaxID=479676 RepID=A0AAV6HVA0_9ERIC|nr:hypothetical protein RHGRI_038179 [Rhododendron griersonianum]